MKILKVVLFIVVILVNSSFSQNTSKSEVLASIKKATEFFSTKVSNRGGYVWTVSEDFSRQYGEIPARKSQIWVQNGTPLVGMALLDVFDITKDKFYLEITKKAADTLVSGQLPLGGWHYMIDFEPKGVQDWYKNQASKFKWGMEEQRFFKNNATFDDGNTANATRFLLRIYLTTKEKKYRKSLTKALDFIVKAQYPNGAFPQRFPLKYDFIHDGFPDYTSYYTLNDGATKTNIEVLVEAYEKLGQKKYLDSAIKAVNFLIAAQGPPDQGCWAEQYDPKTMKPVTARTHEPAGFVVRESEQVIEVLESFYKMTGDKKYLRPIPNCLNWFYRLNKEAIELKRPAARYYELGSNLPIYVIRTNETYEGGYGKYLWSNTQAQGNMQGLSNFGNQIPQVREVVNIDPIRKEYERLNLLDAKKARLEYEKSRGWFHFQNSDSKVVLNIIKTMDKRGAWVTDCRVLKLDAAEKNGLNSGDFEMIKGYSTGVFVRNLLALAGYIKGDSGL